MNDSGGILGAAWLICGVATLGIAGDLVARHGLKQPRGWPRALAAATLAWAWATLGLQVLGASGALGRFPFLAWALLGLAAGVAARVRGRAPEVDPAPGGWDATATVALGLVFWTMAILLAPAFLLPPRVVSDGPIYHLYFAVKWWKAGTIFPVPTPFGETAATYFPANGDLLFSGLMTLFGGDRPARPGQAPFLLLAMAAAIAIARRLGASLPSAIVASAWFVTSTHLILLGFEANVDAIFVAGYLVAVYFGLRYALDDGGTAAVLLAGLAAGLAWGTKPTALLFIPPLVALGGLPVLARPIETRTKLRHLALLGAATLLPTAYWFARNASLTGNPLYPMHAEALGVVWLKGWYRTSAMTRSQYYLPIDDWRALVTTMLVMVDARLAPGWLAAILGAWRWGRRGRPLDRWVWVLTLLALANVATFWLLIPYRTQQRFVLQALGLLATPLALMFDRSRILRRLGVGFLALHVLSRQTWPFVPPDVRAPWALTDHIPSAAAGPAPVPFAGQPLSAIWADAGMLFYAGMLAALAAGCFGSAWLWGRAARRDSGRWGGLAAGASLATAFLYVGGFEAVSGASRATMPVFKDYRDAWAVIERISPPKGWRIAYAGTNLPLYLLAGGLRNEVFYVNVDEHRDWLLHDYHREARRRGDPAIWDTPRPGWDRLHPDYDAWLANLRARRIDLLVVAACNPDEGPFNMADAQRFPVERVWADAHPEVFAPVFPPQGIPYPMRIYRVLPGR